jgi:hypothetical protein
MYGEANIMESTQNILKEANVDPDIKNFAIGK